MSHVALVEAISSPGLGPGEEIQVPLLDGKGVRVDSYALELPQSLSFSLC